MKRGQAWSIDAIVGVFLFIIIVIAVVAFSMSRGHESQVNQLKNDGDRIFSALSEDKSAPVIEDRKVNPDELMNLTKMSYIELKNKMGINSDFCIYFVDENGNLEYIDTYIDSEGEVAGIVGIGSSKVLINGIPCKSG